MIPSILVEHEMALGTLSTIPTLDLNLGLARTLPSIRARDSLKHLAQPITPTKPPSSLHRHSEAPINIICDIKSGQTSNPNSTVHSMAPISLPRQ